MNDLQKLEDSENSEKTNTSLSELTDLMLKNLLPLPLSIGQRLTPKREFFLKKKSDGIFEMVSGSSTSEEVDDPSDKDSVLYPIASTDTFRFQKESSDSQYSGYFSFGDNLTAKIPYSALDRFSDIEDASLSPEENNL